MTHTGVATSLRRSPHLSEALELREAMLHVWRAIEREGLKPMGRNHIHFVPHKARGSTNTTNKNNLKHKCFSAWMSKRYTLNEPVAAC